MNIPTVRACVGTSEILLKNLELSIIVSSDKVLSLVFDDSVRLGLFKETLKRLHSSSVCPRNNSILFLQSVWAALGS